MKLTTLLLLVTLMQVSASSIAQRITLKKDNITLSEVFKEIRKQTDYNVLWSAEKIKKATPINVNFNQTPLEDALKQTLNGQPFTYEIEDKNVIIKPSEQASSFRKVDNKTFSQDISGLVMDSLKTKIAGATVRVKNKNIVTVTGADGLFFLKNVNDGDIITVDFIGYEQSSHVVKGDTYFIYLLNPAVNKLDQVVIQAYGVTTQRLNTGDIGRITAVEIEKNPVINPLLTLQGRIPGLNVTQTSGYASAPINVELRGKTSIAGFPSDPLYVIDGVPLTIIELSGGTNAGGGSLGLIQNGFNGPAGGQSPFFNISPDNIESIEVLKDADATAIYGSRGANGVIIITTKKGKAGKTKFDLNFQQGITGVTKFFNTLNTAQYLEMRKEAFKNDGIDYTSASNVGKAYDLLQWNQQSYTDWQREIFGNTGKNTKLSASVSGGSQETTFRIAAGYNRRTNITTVNGGDELANASLSLLHNALNNRLHLTFSTNYSNSLSDMIDLPSRTSYAPNAPSIYDENGNLNYIAWGGQNTAARKAFPFSRLKQPYSSKTSLLNTNFILSYQLADGLSFSSNFGYNTTYNNQEQFTLIASQDPLSNPTGSALSGQNNNRNLNIEPQLTYSKAISRGKLDILVGGSSQKTATDGQYTSSSGYISDLTIMSLANSTSQSSGNAKGDYKYAGFFGRINFNWDNKYLINISGRRDGSSRFGADNQFGNFGAIGVAWIFTEEKWIKDNLTFLSFGKLRGSYGATGSDGIGDYKYLTRWSADSVYPYGNGSSVIPIQHANPNYQWQINKKLESAISVGLFKDKIMLEASYYQDRTGNQLIDFPVPAYTGFTSVPENSPALVENSGWELSASTNIIQNKKINWSFNFNMAINRNKLVSYPLFELSPYVGRYIVGQPLNISRLLHSTGVDPQTGQYTFEDTNHDGQITFVNDGTPDDSYVIDLSPKFSGGFGTNFSYKNLQLGLFFSYVKTNGRNGSFGNVPGQLNTNQPSSVLSRWQKPGDMSSVARFTTQPGRTDIYFANLSDGVYTDASFIRLSNLSLTYNLPDIYIKKIGLKKCSIFINGNNILVFTKYKGLDPETQIFGGLPPVRTIVAGVNFNF